MSDMTLCSSEACRAREICRRNECCPKGYPWDPHYQSVAGWHPAGGQSCPGFIDMRHDWRASPTPKETTP